MTSGSRISADRDIFAKSFAVAVGRSRCQDVIPTTDFLKNSRNPAGPVDVFHVPFAGWAHLADLGDPAATSLIRAKG